MFCYDNHLSTPYQRPVCTCYSRAPVPLPILGFSLVGFTSVPLPRFPRDIVTVALYKRPTIVSLRFFVCRHRCLGASTYLLIEHKHYQHFSWCEHGLSSTIACSDYLSCYLLNTASSNRDTLLRMSTCEN